MPSKDSKQPVESGNNDVKRLFDELLPYIPAIVRQVCASLNHYPKKMGHDGYIQRIIVLLMEKDYERLRSFDNKSSPQTWLFAVAKHDIEKQLRRQSKMLSLEDLFADSLVSPPEQDQILISKEKERQLLEVHRKLTEAEKILFALLWEGRSATEVARVLKIKKESVWRKKSALIKKMREMLQQLEKDR